jgi:hypothetical protein
MKFRDSWRAVWTLNVLHISGTTDLFPNDFSTASLERDETLDEAATVAYRLVFDRDKEPFCDKDLVGPVRYLESSLPVGARRLRVVLPGDHGSVELAVPTRPVTLMIALLRSVVAVLIGYIVFAVSAYAVFRLSGHAAHAVASVPFMLVSIASGVVFAIVGGYIAAWLAGRRPLAHAVAMAVLLAVGATVSLASTLGHGAIWSQVAALTLMAPGAVLGGWIRARSVAA